MSVAHDQDLGNGPTGPGIQTGSFTATASSPKGEVVIAYAATENANGGASQLLNVSDSLGSSYAYALHSNAGSPNDNVVTLAAARLPAPVVSGATTFTRTWDSGSGYNYAAFGASTFRGILTTAYAVNSIAQTASNTGGITTSASVNPGDLVVAYALAGTHTTPEWTLPSGWTLLQQFTNGASTMIAAYQIPTSAGTVTFNPTHNGSLDTDCTYAIAAYPAGTIGGIGAGMLL